MRYRKDVFNKTASGRSLDVRCPHCLRRGGVQYNPDAGYILGRYAVNAAAGCDCGMCWVEVFDDGPMAETRTKILDMKFREGGRSWTA